MKNSDVEVPGPDAHWWTEINEFALTFNAYNRNGDLDVVSSISDRVRQAWEHDATLPNDLDVCRTILAIVDQDAVLLNSRHLSSRKMTIPHKEEDIGPGWQ